MERAGVSEAAAAAAPEGPDVASLSFSFSFPATPSALYRSAFARDCEAIALQLRDRAAEASPSPPLRPAAARSPSRWPSTIEAEALTPLEPPPPPPSSSSSSSSSGCGSFLSEAGPAREPNRTYDCQEDEEEAEAEGEAGSGRRRSGTFLCPRSASSPSPSPSPSGALAAPLAGSLRPDREQEQEEGASPKARRRTFELPGGGGDPGPDAPLVTSTPAAEPRGSGGGVGGKRALLSPEEAAAEGPRREGRGGGGGERCPPRPAPGGEAAGKGPRLAPRSLAAAAAARGASRPGGGSGGGGGGTPLGLGLGLGLLPRRPGTKRPGGRGPSQPRGQKQLPDECPSKLPRYKSTSSVSNPKLARGVVAGASSNSMGLEHKTTCKENEVPGRRLPVQTAGDKISKAGAEKRLLERPADSSSVQKPPKRACQGRGLMEQRAGRALLAAGQIPRADPGNGPVPVCLKCLQLSEENQQLTEEIWRLRALLDNSVCKGDT